MKKSGFSASVHLAKLARDKNIRLTGLRVNTGKIVLEFLDGSEVIRAEIYADKDKIELLLTQRKPKESKRSSEDPLVREVMRRFGLNQENAEQVIKKFSC
ncbi:MAG: hypothetical protein HY928_16230 [Elusimicrobia bacterium]|nr:hypothetical protein [Elusimicrobiota bacterium]